MNLEFKNIEPSANDLKGLSDKDLISRVASFVRQERQILEGLIWHLQEVQDRKLFISMGYTSLYECLVKHFGYSEGVAYAKISAVKIISAVPEAAKALKNGEVTLTTLSLAQSFIRQQEKKSGHKVSAQEKMQLLEIVKNKTTQEVKQTIAELNPAMELPKDKVIYLSANDVQLLITTDKQVMEKIEKLKSLISHENIDPNYSQILHLALDAAIEKKERLKGIKVLEKADPAPVNSTGVQQSGSPSGIKESSGLSLTRSNSIKSSRVVPPKIKRQVLRRSQGRCEFIHPNGLRCDSRFQLQFDHIKAFSRGGTSEFENIQSLCRIHNSYKGSR